MSVFSTELPSSFVRYSPQLSIRPSRIPHIEAFHVFSRYVTWTSGEPFSISAIEETSSLTVFSVPKDTRIGGWLIKSVLLIRIFNRAGESVATTWLEGLTEYGSGAEGIDAIEDLIVSLGEYRESLENRKADLGESALRELDGLRKLIERVTG